MVPDSWQLRVRLGLCSDSAFPSLKDTVSLPSRGVLRYSDCLCLFFFMEKVGFFNWHVPFSNPPEAGIKQINIEFSIRSATLPISRIYI